MCADNLGIQCKNTRPYYQVLLGDEHNERIPEELLKHIAECRHCRAEIIRLKALLQNPDKSPEDKDMRKNSYINNILRLHFAYIEESVNCSNVKPFLPLLAVPSLEIKIPTPITVHLDHCRVCSDDLSGLKKLQLTQNQLIRLARFLARETSESFVSCRQAQAFIPAATASGPVKTAVLQHLNTCSDCRKLLYQHWESVRSKLLDKESTQNKPYCNKFSKPELFDYCFPYGLDLSDGNYADLRESVNLHLPQCLGCLDDMLHLRRTIYSIAERPDSGIVTNFTMQQEGEAALEADSGSLYADWPVNVKVFNTGKRRLQTTAVDFKHALKRRVSSWNIKRFVKPAIGAALASAAAILIASALFLNLSTAKAVTWQDVRRGIANIKTACITEFSASGQEPTPKRWVSKTLNILMYKTGEQYVLWDLNKKVKKTTYTYSNSVESEQLSEEALAREKEESLTAFFALNTFSQLIELPENAVWRQVTDEGVKAKFAGKVVYDLTWLRPSAPLLRWEKFRFYLEPDTNAPKRIEYYDRVSPEKNYTLGQYFVITYPGDDEIRATIKRIFK